jgi:1,4-alpha-glucan branching enzyme
MTYGWEFHHLLNDIAMGHKNADSLAAYLKKDALKYDSTAFRMYFTSNHDENSWNGTVFERMGDAYEVLAVLTATVPAMPLIYSGQEAGLDKRLPFFDKDSISWKKLPYEEFYKKLLRLKHQNQALWNGQFGGKLERVNTAHNSENIFAFSRKKNGNEVMVITNLSDSIQSFIPNQAYRNKTYSKFNNPDKKVTFANEAEPLRFDAWSYMILTSNKK